MKLIIGEYANGKLTPGTYAPGDEVDNQTLQELKGRFTTEYRVANIKLTEQQLLAAATPDQDIIQAIHSFENLDTLLNTLGKYTTEWYELHHPDEIVAWTVLADKALNEPGLMELNISVQMLIATRDRIKEHIEEMMQKTLPNTTAVAGGLIGAKLLAAAGGTPRLATFPSTTVQLLGAEQALFRHLRNRNALPPKYGILFNHPLVQKAPYNKKGKMARTLANVISLAAKIDYYKGEYAGEQLKAKVEAQARALTRT
jgi:nucleolar protein 56